MKKISLGLFASVLSVWGLSGCSYTSDAIFPSLFGSDTQENIANPAPVADSGNSSADLPELGTTNFEPLDITEGGNTGTFVGQKVIGFRKELGQLQDSIRKYNEDLQKLRASIINNAMQYQKVIGAIEAKLQVGTTPGNPQMYALLQNAQNSIQIMSSNTNALNRLSARVTSDAAMTTYLLDSIQSAFGVSGAVDEDHRQLRILENETNQTAILFNSLSAELNNDIMRQQQYLETAQNNIVDLNSAIKVGNYNGVNYYGNNASVSPSYTTNSGYRGNSNVQTKKTTYSSSPLFVAKFNKKDVNFKDGLRQAVGSAMQRKQNVMFEVVAITPLNGSALSKSSAQNNAGMVFEEMIKMGVSPDKISLGARTSETASSAEVHIYVK